MKGTGEKGQSAQEKALQLLTGRGDFESFDEWIEKNILVEESKLLTKPESDYFSFLLNHEKFSNGYDIRNKYAHGAGQIITDENEHKMNYNILLRLMVILAIKINDEFCLFSRHTNEITDSEE